MPNENPADIDPDFPDEYVENPAPEPISNPSESEDTQLLKKLAKMVETQGEAIEFLLAEHKKGAPEPGSNRATDYDKPHKASELSSLKELAQIFGMLITPIVQVVEGSVKLGATMGEARAIAEIEGGRAEDLENELKAIRRQLTAASEGKNKVDVKSVLEAINPVIDRISTAMKKT